jgi:hypothetical protein
VPRAHLSAALKTFRVLRQLIASIYRIGRFTDMSEKSTGNNLVQAVQDAIWQPTYLDQVS